LRSTSAGIDLAIVVIQPEVGLRVAACVQALSKQADTAADVEHRQRTVGNDRDRGGIDRIASQLGPDVKALQPMVIKPGDVPARGAIDPASDFH